jgi:predicted PurR-regulated permease PerM
MESQIAKELKKLPEVRALLVVLLIITTGFLLKMAWGVISHFSDLILLLFLAWLVSFILEPLIIKLGNLSLSRPGGTLLVYAGLALLFLFAAFLIIPQVLSQLTTLAFLLPEYFAKLPAGFARFQDVLVSAISNSVNLITVAFSFFLSLFLVIFLSFYLSLDRPKIGRELLGLVPKDYQDEALFVVGVIHHSFAQFFRIQLFFGILSGIATWLAMLVLRIQFAATAALLAGIFTVIPLIGPFLAIVPPVLLGFLDSAVKGWIILVLLIIFQQIEFNAIGPKLLGSALKVHPLVVLLSFLLGYKLMGIWGSLFAVPVMSILVTITRELWKHWLVREN